MRNVPKALLRRLDAIERLMVQEAPAASAQRRRVALEQFVGEIESEQRGRLIPHRLPPAKCSLATLVYRWGSHWAPDDPAPTEIEHELLRRLARGPDGFLQQFFHVVDQAERYREAMAAGDPELFFRPLSRAESKERFDRLMALCEAAQRGDVARESVPLICRPVPDDLDRAAPSAGQAGRTGPAAGESEA
jgi:hypothetical protein